MQRALGTIPADRTAVIITHRLSTVEIADWVLVLEHSQILENGSPAELEAQGGRYVGLHKPGRSHLPDGDVSEAHPESEAGLNTVLATITWCGNRDSNGGCCCDNWQHSRS